jgi:hypothetical protein
MGKTKNNWPALGQLQFCTRATPKRLMVVILAFFMFAAGASAEDMQPQTTDTASNPPSVTPQNDNTLRTSVSGRWQSEMIMSQRSRIRYLDDGSAERTVVDVYPFYNTISLRADEIGHKGLSIHFQGWAAIDLGDIYFQERVVADPTYLYLQFRDYGFDIKAGRQFVYQGAARALHIDGISFSYQSSINLGIQAIGGLIVTPKQGPNWYEEDEPGSYSDFGSGFSDWKREGLFGD